MSTGLDPQKSNAELQFGLRLQGFRESAGLSQEALAEEFGLSSSSSISDWENARAIPQLEPLRRYIRKFDAAEEEELLALRSAAIQGRKVRRTNEKRQARRAETSEPEAIDAEFRTAPDVVPTDLGGHSRGWSPTRRHGLSAGVVAVLVVLIVVAAAGGFSGSSHRRGWYPPDHAGSGIGLTVDSRSAIGAHMRMDVGAPLELTTRPVSSCHGCVIAGTVRHTGQLYRHAVCEVYSDSETNGNMSSPGIERNPGLATSRRWFGIRQPNGTLGFVSAVWISARQRPGIQLPTCPRP